MPPKTRDVISVQGLPLLFKLQIKNYKL